MFISWKSNPSCNLCHFPGADTQMKMMGILVLSLPSSKLLDCGKGKRIRSFLLFSHVLRNLQSQGTGLDTFYFIKRNKASLWQGGICFVILCVREEWPFKHHIIANMRCYDNSRIEISLLLLYPLCWLSFTSNEYFLIVCSIEHWKSQCRKKQTRICHFYRVNIELKYPGTVSVEVLSPPNQPYVLQCTGRGRSCYERDCLEERFCFWWSFGPLIVTCCDVLLHRISTNKARQTYWPKKKNVLEKKKRGTLSEPNYTFYLENNCPRSTRRKKFMLRTIGTRHCPFLSYKQFIPSRSP